MTARDLEKSFSFDKTVEITSHVCFFDSRANIIVNTCYISSGMGVTKASNSKSDLQGDSLAVVPFDRPHMTCYYYTTITMSLSCIVSETLLVISQNLKRSYDLNTSPLEVIYHAYTNTCQY